MDLGRPINVSELTDARMPAPRDRFDDGEHGAGIGLAGGFDQPRVTSDSFNSGLGGSHASSGIPTDTPIADKFMSTSSSSKQETTQQSFGDGETVSGAYVGSGTNNALTGQSAPHSRETGAGSIGTTSDIGSTGSGAEYGTGVGAVGGAGGHYRREDDFNMDSTSSSSSSSSDQHRKGRPLSEPKDLDTGGPHSLVYVEETGKYEHRRNL